MRAWKLHVCNAPFIKAVKLKAKQKYKQKQKQFHLDSANEVYTFDHHLSSILSDLIPVMRNHLRVCPQEH